MVIISNGHGKFILGTAAAEVHKFGLLDAYITAGYPLKCIQGAINKTRIGKKQFINTLLARKEVVPDHLVHPMWKSEMLMQLAVRFKWPIHITEAFEVLSMRQYGSDADKIVRNLNSRIYHYRSGYGHTSVLEAKQKGMIALCDHSIAHPTVLQYLVENKGHLPRKGEQGPISKFWLNVLNDIIHADHVIVNSDFVRDTFLNQGYPADRIHVVYTGLDQQFLDAVPIRIPSLKHRRPIKLLFAGMFGPRKGSEILVEALSRLKEHSWQLGIIGEIDPFTRTKFASFLESDRVILLGIIPRLQLAEQMSEADIFIFPSLAEGSARVIFMAMACGCYVITTPNSGSVVQDGVNGALIPPGDVNALETSIRQAMQSREELERVGHRNANIIKSKYKQTDYGLALIKVYEHILNVTFEKSAG